MTAFIWRMVGTLVAAMIGLAMIFWSLERSTLISLGGEGTPGGTPFSVYVVVFGGLLVLGFAIMTAVRLWTHYLRENPGASQLPTWFAIALILLAGGALVIGTVTHGAWLQDQETVPSTVSDGYIMFQVLMASLVLVPLVLAGVRWIPQATRG